MYLVTTVLRDADGKLHGHGISPWPSGKGALVTAPVWSPDPTNPRGIQGLQPGEQEPSTWHLDYHSAVWVILSVDADDLISVDGESFAQAGRLEWACRESRDAAKKIVSWLRQRGVDQPIYRGAEMTRDGTLAKVGRYGQAASRAGGQVQAGEGGTLVFFYRDESETQMAIAYVGHWAMGLPKGQVILAHAPYRVEGGAWVRVI